MRLPRSMSQLPKVHYGKRAVMDCVIFIENAFDYAAEHNIPIHITEIVKVCSQEKSIPETNIFRWWKYYRENHEIHPIVNERMRNLGRRYKYCNSTNPAHIVEIKRIIERHPEYYLDEIAKEFAIVIGVMFSIAKISRLLRRHMGYSLQVCYHRTRQRNVDDRLLFQVALYLLLKVHMDPRMLIYVDETHKDRNTSRRKRAWGRRNSGGQ